MKKSDRCASGKQQATSVCRTVKDIETVQPFPSSGLLAENLGLPWPVLKSQIGKIQDRAYSYIVRTVKLDHERPTFEQHGSAPNFQGGVLTLCTCKHQMRATRSTEDWQGVWVAGFTSRTIHAGRHWLFYLAKIKTAHESHSDLWSAMKVRSRNAKAADAHFLGDIFKPKSPLPTGNTCFSSTRYITPAAHAHRQHRGDKGWHNDINYYLAAKYRHPPLLVADPQQTFLWDDPMICFAGDHCRNFRKWSSLTELVAQLGVAK
jgi:hypothetical protein